ncbi:MAG: thiamine diphosphokinase [Acidimicrobiia bacterium]
MGLALVFAGGDRPSPASVRELPPPEFVIAADSGVEHALALGFAVDLIVGDFDSADPAAVAAAVAGGAAVDRHPAAKDETDLELALVAARHHGLSNVVVIGGAGGRLDHFLANALLLASPAFADLQISARVGEADVAVVRDVAELQGRPGDLCSLLALGGPAAGVHTVGLRFPLDRETLFPGSTRGVSNELLESSARVTLDGGVLLVVLPYARKEA